MWQGEEIEFALTCKDPTDLSKTFAPDLLKQLLTEKVKEFYGINLVLRINRPKEPYVHFLANGGKVYVDEITRQGGGKYRLFEIATPEVSSSLEVVQYDRAAEKIAHFAAQLLNANEGLNIECYKTSIARDVEGNYTSRGAHESYRVRKRFLAKINSLIPFLVLRQLVCGSGGYYNDRFVISPRQFFIERTISEMTIPVPLVCLRSESLSVDEGYMRLQILNGDATRLELSTFLRFALTSLVIQGIEEGFIEDVPELEDPLEAARTISESCDPSCLVRLKDGRRITAVDYFQEYYVNPLERQGHEIGLNKELKSAGRTFEEIVTDLHANKLERLTRKIEWIVKLDLFEWDFDRYFDRDPDIASPKETANNAYCAVTDSLFEELENELGLVRLFNDEEVEHAISEPPVISRARARVKIAERFKDYVDEIDWDHLVIGGEKFMLHEDVVWNDESISNMISEIQRGRQW